MFKNPEFKTSFFIICINLIVIIAIIFSHHLNLETDISSKGLTFTSPSTHFLKTGGNLFEKNCKTCHSINQERQAPPLKNIVTQYREREWVNRMVKDPQSLINSGDSLANALLNQYNGEIMPSFAHLNNTDINAIVYYVEHNVKN